MNLYRLATEGVDLDALPLEESQQPRASFQFEPSTRTPERIQAPGELDDVFNFAAQEYGVDVDVLRGIAYAESRFNPDIISGKVKSPAGAIGLMQFMPETAKEYGIDPTDPVQAIIGGAAYLRKSLDKFDGDYERAVASYNWGPNRKAYDSEDWASKAPAETQKYLMTVFDAAGRFKDGASEQTATTRPETQATPLPAGVTPSAAGGGRGVISPGDINTKLTRTAVPDMTAGSVARDVASGVLQIGPTVVQGVGDLIGLASGNRLGGSVRKFAKEGKQAIQQVVGSERAQAQAQNFAADMADDSVSLGQAIANNKGALADQLLPAVGSMLLPIGAAGAAGKLATVGKTAQGLSKAALAARVASAQHAAGIGATAAQNAASTFAELVDKGVSLPDAYAAAGITVPFSVIAGKLTGGGVEGALVRGATNPASIAKGAGELLLKAPLREGAQEGGEALGQVAGEVLGADQDVSLQSAIKRVGTEALLGGVMGGGFNAAQQLAAPTVEAQPTTPQAPTVTPQAPAAPDAAKTQAVDNIAAAIQEMEGAATQTAPVQPGSPAADAGAAPVAQGAADTSGGLATDGEAVAAGQPEQAGALTEAQPVATAQAVDQAQPVSPYQDLGEELAAIKARSQPAPQAETLPTAQEQAAPVQAQPATSVLAAEMAQMKSRNQATKTVDVAKPAPVGIGRNNTPLSEGGKPFKTKAEADTARKLQPMMRVKKRGKGFVLVEKTPAQIAAQEIAARRNLGGVGSGGGPLSAHAFLASMGGLNKSTMADLGFDRNVRVGSKWLFTNTGMTMERMTEALQQSGYVQGTEQKTAIDLVSKSAKGQPQYTAEGWDQIAQAEATARFEDHLAAQQEAAMADEDFDPFVPGAIGEDFSRDDFAMAGYDTASPEDSSEFAAMLAAAQAEGIDTEAILERAAQQTQSGTYEDYRNQVRALIGAARGERVAVVEGAGSQQGREDAQRQGAGDDRAGIGREGASGVDGEGLTAYTPAEVTARQDAAAEAETAAKRAEDAAARAEAAAKQASEIAQRSVAAADTFELGQSAEDNLSGQAGLKFSFAGTRAATADRMSLMTAQDRIDAGEDAELVRQQTGWHKGVDGRWRFEISDNEAKVDTTLLGNLARGGFDARPIEFITYRKEADGTYSLSMSPANPTRTSDFVSLSGVPESLLPSILPMDAQDAIRRGDGEADIIGPNLDDAKRVRAPFQFEGFNALPLGVVMDHPKLFAAYPALRDIMVQVDASLGNGATFAEMEYVDGTTGKAIKIGNPRAPNVDNVLLHEIQHGIQSIEGFATGGSIKDFESKQSTALPLDVVSAALDIRTFVDKYSGYGTTLDGIKAKPPAQFRSLPDAAWNLAKARTTESLQREYDFSRRAFDPVDSYRRLAGEVEARNTQARQGMTDAERRVTPPSATADVPDSNVIVVMNGKEMAMAPMPANSHPKTNKPIAILDGTEVAAEITHDNAVEVAREWYRANLQGDTVTREGLGEIRFSGKGMREMRLGLRNDTLKAKLLPSVRAIIQLGKYYGREALYKTRNDGIVAFHFFEGGVSVDGKNVLAGVTVGEDENGNLFYNVSHENSRGWKDRSPQSLPRDATDLEGLQANSEPSTRQSVSDDDGNVNLVILDGAPTGTPTTTIREAIAKAYGNLLPRLESKGLVYLTQTEEDAIADAAQARAAKIGGDVEAIKQALRKAVVAQVGDSSIDVKYSQDGHLEGFFDPEIGRAYLIADGLTEQSAPGTLMHEVGIHMAADGKLQPMFERAAKLIRLGRNNPFLRRVQARLDAAGETSAEEAAAYLVTEYENSRLSAPPSVVLWVQDFIADIRAWLFSKGVLLKADQLTMADVVAVARANARRLSMQAVDAQAGGAYTQPNEDNQPTADDKDRVAKLSAAVARFFNISEPASGPAYRAVQLPDAADLQSIGSAFGKRVVGFGLNPVLAGSKSPFSTAGGVSLPSMPDTVFINASSDRPHLSVLGHELAHTLRRENPALFDEMVEAIRPYIKQTEYGYEFTKERVARDLRKPDAIREEFVGEVLSDGFTQSAFWEALGRKSPSTLARVMDAVVNLIGKARRAFSPQRRTEKYLTDFDRVMEIAGEVMAKYSPDSEASIRRSVGGGQQQAVTTWDDLGDSKMDALIYEGQDDRIDLKRVQENIVKAGRQIREEFDARMAETLFPGRVAKRNESFVDQEVKPLLQAMAASNVSMEELGDYLLARHAPERNAQIAKVNPDMPDGGAGTNSQGVLMTTQAANDYIANLSPGKRIAMQLLAKRVDAITKGTRDILVTEGLEKASTVAAWEGAYQNYVPLFKDEAAETPGHPVGSGFSVKGGASKRAMGSTKEVTNVLAHVLMQREAAITRAEKNRVGMSLYGLALSNPNKEFWGTVVPKMSTPEIMAELQNMGVNVADAFAGMEATPTIRYVDPNTGMVTERPNPVYKNLDNALVVKVNGEDRVILFNKSNDRAMRLVESLKNQNRGSGVFVDGANLVAPVTRFMASMLTQYNPAFGMVNAVRDVQGALVNLSSTELKGKQAKVLADVPAAMKGIARDLRGDKARTQWSDLWVQFQDDGGRTGIRDLISDPYEKAGQIEKDLKRLSKEGKLTPGNAAHAVLDLLSDFNDTLENGVRLAAYKAAIDQGMSRPAAAKLARELTVDFNRKGRTGRELGKLYAFLNASIQGSARTIQTLKGPMGAKIMAGGFALGVLQAFMLAAAGFDDDDIPEFIKSRNLIIPMGGDRYVTIPMALGLHVLPNTGRAVTELIMSGGKDIGEKSLNTIVEIVTAFNPFGGGGDWKTAHGPLTMITPTVMDPVIDMAMNRDFAGRQISKERRPSGDVRPGATMARESTKQSPSGQVYIGISEAINAATGGTDVTKGALSPTPEELRYLATVVGGGVYRETERAINAAVLLARGEEVKPHQVPLGSRFAGEVDDEMSTMGRYYKNDEKLNAFWAEFKAEAKDGNTERVEAMKRDPMFAAAAMNSKIEQYITKINKLAGENVGDKEKYEALNKKRAELMKKVNDAVKEAEKQ